MIISRYIIQEGKWINVPFFYVQVILGGQNG